MFVYNINVLRRSSAFACCPTLVSLHIVEEAVLFRMGILVLFITSLNYGDSDMTVIERSAFFLLDV